MQMHNEYCFPYKKKKHEKKTTNTFIKTEKRRENHLLEKKEKTVPSKSLFDLSRYLDRSPRYKDRKFAQLSNR